MSKVNNLLLMPIRDVVLSTIYKKELLNNKKILKV